MTIYAYASSPVGDLLLVGGEPAAGRVSRLQGLYFSGHRRGPAVVSQWRRDDDAFIGVRDELNAYFTGRLRDFHLDLEPLGTPFQREVWAALQAVPFGSTTSYGELARTVGRPGAARAVGAAVGRNRISIVVPCHRIVGVTGTMTGYAGGVERKQWLLALERSHVLATQAVAGTSRHS